jgi:sortase (surface protein transpeptidase)
MKVHGETSINSASSSGVVYSVSKPQKTSRRKADEPSDYGSTVIKDIPRPLQFAETEISKPFKIQAKRTGCARDDKTYINKKERKKLASINEVARTNVELSYIRGKPNRLAALSKVFATAAAVVVLIAYGPSAYYAGMQAFGLNINYSFRNETLLAVEVNNDAVYKPAYKPAYDATLPEENRVIIRSVGIDTPILEAPEENFEDALRKGVWREVRYGTPETRNNPTMLVAHRYGYLAWSVPYRLRNSFFNLPKLQVGDTVEVVWKQRKYIYTVYAEEISEKPSDFTADLILYTCKDLNSDMAIFKYGKLLEI